MNDDNDQVQPAPPIATDKIISDDSSNGSSNTMTLQHKLMFPTNTAAMSNSTMQISSSYQERKVIFIEQARRFVKMLEELFLLFFFLFTENSYKDTVLAN